MARTPFVDDDCRSTATASGLRITDCAARDPGWLVGRAIAASGGRGGGEMF